MKHPYVAYLLAAAATVLLACGSVRADRSRLGAVDDRHALAAKEVKTIGFLTAPRDKLVIDHSLLE